jgi:hypothetical protein
MARQKTKVNRHPELSAKLESVRANKAAELNERLSIRKVSQSSGVDYAHAYRIFHGQALPSRDILLKICRAMRCNQKEASEIFAQTDHRTPSLDELEESASPRSAA